MKHSQQNQMFTAALAWLALGVPVLPVQPGSKRLVCGFGPRSRKITNPDQARAWFDRRFPPNLAVVTGGAAGLVVLDFDQAEHYERWCASVGALAETLTETTRRPGGRHVFFFLAGVVASGAGAGCEIKGDGGAVVVAPSKVGGVRYQVVSPGGGVLRVSAAALDLLPLSEIRQTKSYALSEGGQASDAVSRIKRAFDLEDEVKRAGVRLTGRGDILRGRCPFHNDKQASFWLVPGREVWGCWACFGDRRGGIGGDIINFVARRDGLTVREAINKLASALPGRNDDGVVS